MTTGTAPARRGTRLAGALASTYRSWSIAAAAWTAPYVASKVHFALAGELGVTGGPEVPASAYATYDPGEVAAAQWGNAAVGTVGMLLLMALLLPIALRVNRWVLLVPLGALCLTAAAAAVGMLAQALLTDAGGAVFGGYCAVWATLIAAAALGYRGRRTAR